MKQKNKKEAFIYAIRHLRSIFIKKFINRKRKCKSRRRIFKSSGRNLKKALISPHPLINFEIKDCYENEPRFNGVYFRHNLPKVIKYGAYIINLDEYGDVGTHWVALYVKNNEVIYFDSFGVEHVFKEIKRYTRFFLYKKNFYKKMSLKNPKT